MQKFCEWNDDHAISMVHRKKAVSAALFLSFLGYTAAAIISEVKRETKVTYPLS